MSDFFVELGQRPAARRVVKTLGLPVPLPQKLERDVTPWTEQPLADRQVVITGPGGDLAGPLAETFAAAGAIPWVAGDLKPFEAAGEAWGRRPERLDLTDVPAGLRPYGIAFDATGLKQPSDLRALYDAFHPILRSLKRCGRVVVIGRPHDSKRSVAAAATQRALEGFVRSVAKEVGRKGSTANLVTVAGGAESRLEPVLRFLVSPRSAFVSGQPLHLSKKVKFKGDFPKSRPLEGKVALVTGAARGIGAATARALAREGAHVLVLDRPADDAPASAVAAEVHGTPVLVDVTSPDAAEIILAAAVEHGGLDIVIHNAGVTRDKTLAKMPEGLWDMTIAINLEAVLNLTDQLLPELRDGGRVVCLSSIAGIGGNVGQTNYATSKAGVIGFVEGLAASAAKRGIAVNGIAPGFIETRLTHAIPVATREVARRLSNLSQGGLPEDVAEVLTFLSSPGAAGLSGQILRVCGGNLMGA